MGASLSKNVSDAVTRAVAKVSSNIIQKTKLSQDMSQVVSVRHVHGDVHISGNTFRQQANVNMHTLLEALSTEEAQQSIMQELAQEAKSITSGLNIGQFSDAQNTLNLLMEATINLLTTISQTCKAFNSQHQEIIVDRVVGNVFIQNNVFDQMYYILQNCTEKATSENSLIQDLTSKLSQTASATSEGLSPWAIVALVAAFVGIPVIGGVVAGKAILKYIFPVIMVAGVVFIVLYFVKSSQIMKEVGFSTMIAQTPICSSGIGQIPDQDFSNIVDVSNACFENKLCQAFDWQGVEITKNGDSNILEKPKITFFNQVSKDCRSSIKPDNARILRSPTFFKGPQDPDLTTPAEAIKGDVYLNTGSTIWFQKKQNEWQMMGTITTKPFNRIDWGHVNPTVQPENVFSDRHLLNDIYIYANQHNPLFLNIFRFGTNGWVLEQKVNGPGLVPDTPTVINTSGFKEIQRQSWMLYAGIAGLVIGTIGMMILFMKKEKFS